MCRIIVEEHSMKIQVTDGDSSKISFNDICTMHKHLTLIPNTVISNPVMFTRMCIMSCYCQYTENLSILNYYKCSLSIPYL